MKLQSTRPFWSYTPITVDSGYAATGLRGYGATGLRDYVATRLRGYAATWLRGYTANPNSDTYLNTNPNPNPDPNSHSNRNASPNLWGTRLRSYGNSFEVAGYSAVKPLRSP